MKIKTIIVQGRNREKDDNYINDFLKTVKVIDVKLIYLDVECGLLCYLIMYEEINSL